MIMILVSTDTDTPKSSRKIYNQSLKSRQRHSSPFIFSIIISIIITVIGIPSSCSIKAAYVHANSEVDIIIVIIVIIIIIIIRHTKQNNKKQQTF